MQRYTDSSFRTILWLTGVLASLWAASNVYACPMCKYGLVSVLNPGYVSRLSQGYYWSILLLLGVPPILITSMSILVIRSRR